MVDCFPLHQWSWGKGGEHFEVPGNYHHWKPVMVFTHCHPGTLPNFSRGVIQVFYCWICLFGWWCHSSHMLRSSHAWYQLFCGVSFSGPVEHVQLLTPFVVIRNKEVNITAVVLPSHSRTVTYFWWLGNNTEVIVLVQGSLIHSSVLVSIAY